MIFISLILIFASIWMFKLTYDTFRNEVVIRKHKNGRTKVSLVTARALYLLGAICLLIQGLAPWVISLLAK